ncbi:aminotransferase class III-fold pyridoxal phosphate-dependent enzyme [Enterococcus mundtii]|nr:aminotransferase class III-fold pyridoxal phosphate-dependent enzyme [Enterococcus mundtii]
MNNRKKKYFWHPMTDTRASEEETIVIERGDGNFIYDDTGRKLLDGVGGLWCMNVGHNRPEMNRAIADQMENYLTINCLRILPIPRHMTWQKNHSNDARRRDGESILYFWRK